MATTYEHISALLEKFVTNNCTAEEQAELARLLREADEKLYGRVMDTYAERVQLVETAPVGDAGLLQAIRYKLHTIEEPTTPVRRISRRMLAIAASIALLLSTGTAWLIVRQNTPALTTARSSGDKRVEPGINKAMLTLSDGTKVPLEEQPEENIAEGQTKAKQKGGTIRYDRPSNVAAPVVYHTLSTPRGKQFKVVLSDGTTVWLNAASSIRFPTAFTGSDRLVELSGEAYFDVAANANKPFMVKSARSTVQVLGTEFDIMAYDNEPLHQTLLVKGSVRVESGRRQLLLEPGKMATIAASGLNMEAREANVKQVTAWKDGRISLNTTDLRSLMRQIERWFDVDVVFNGNPPQRKFGGWMSQNVTLETFLEFLTENGVHNRLEGRKLIISE